MNKNKGCLPSILIILGIILLAGGYWGLLGLFIVGWAIYELNIDRRLEAKSKKPAIILTVGILITITGFSTNNNSATNESAEEKPKQVVQSPITEKNEVNTVTSEEAVDEPQNEISDEPESPNYIAAKIVNIVDGDTVDVEFDGKEERVRLILIDTPETRHPDKPVQPFGSEASQFTKEQLENKEVKLELDAQERDQYGRLLAYIWVGEQMHNKTLIEKGLARVAVYPPNTKYVDEFKETQKQAQEKAVGIWSIENYATESGFNDSATTPTKSTNSSSGSSNNSNSDSNSNANTSSPSPAPSQNVYYKNCSAARAAGVTPIYRGEPGYAKHLDRDGDGIACE